MTGKLVKKNEEWVVRYDKNHDEVFYVLHKEGTTNNKTIKVSTREGWIR